MENADFEERKRKWHQGCEGYQILAYWPNSQTEPAIDYVTTWEEALNTCVTLVNSGLHTIISARDPFGMEPMRFWGQ